MKINVKNGWVFSRREDLCFFVVPLLLGIVFVALDQYYDLKSVRLMGKDSLIILFALMAFLDAGHVFSTVFKSYFDRETRAQRKFLLYVIPVLIYLFLITVYNLFGMRPVLLLFGYYNVYHVIRQQYGWVSITARRAAENNRFDYYLDKTAIYSFMIIPVIWIHLKLPASEKQLSVPKNDSIANVFVALWLAIFVIYLLRQGYKLYKGAPLNLSKIMQMVTSFIAWGMVIFFQSPVLLVVTVMLHSIPYLGIVYKNSSAVRSGRGFLYTYRFPLLFFAAVIILAGVLYTKTNNFVKQPGLNVILGIPKEYFICALLLFPIMHFTIDGVIWRKKAYRVDLNASQ